MNACWTTLVSPEALEQLLGDPSLVVLDCRFSLADPGAGEVAYAQAHLPAARYAHLDRDLSGPPAPGAGRHPWPSSSMFSARLRGWGISPATQVVVYDDGDGAYAARAWFLLRAAGHAAVAVLDGGWRRWLEQGRPVDASLPVFASTAHEAGFDHGLLLDAAQVQAHLDAGGVLIDARAPERFRGEVEPIDRVAGHVPGAVNRPYASNLAAGGFKPAAQLRAEFDTLLQGRPATDVVAMCGSGVTACHHLLVMTHAGLAGGRLFAGSWSGWISDLSRPRISAR